jgi:hypothetical protein
VDIQIHHFGLAGREPLLFMLAASLLTLAGTRTYTRLARVRGWRSGRVGDVHVHHLVVGIVLALVAGMLDIALRPGGFGRELLAFVFGAGAAFILDEFALSVHLRDVYWSSEGRRSIEVSLMWVLLGALLLVGISPFGIHDSSEGPRAVGFAIVAVSILLSASSASSCRPSASRRRSGSRGRDPSGPRCSTGTLRTSSAARASASTSSDPARSARSAGCMTCWAASTTCHSCTGRRSEPAASS